MNCLIILLLLACGGWRGGQNCGCGCTEMGNGDMCCQRGTDRGGDCPCAGEGRGSMRRSKDPDDDCHDHRMGGPAAWNEGREGRHGSYPSISGGETCGCDAE